MDNNAELDPWANMGNIRPENHNSEASPENLTRAAEWEQSMSDAPKFAGDNPEQPTTEITDNAGQETENRDENIADASAILNYNLNAAAREKGVNAVVNTIKNFVYKGQGDPIAQLLTELGIDTPKEFNEFKDESRATKSEENLFRDKNINASATLNRSTEGALNAIQEFKLLITEIESSPGYNTLRAEALKDGKNIYDEAISKYNVRDLTTLFNALNEQKDNQKEDQIENQSSMANSSPETDATASEESLL